MRGAILLLDDDTLEADRIKTMISMWDQDVEVVHVRRGPDAQEQVTTHRDVPFTLAVVDLLIEADKNRGGAEFVRWLLTGDVPEQHQALRVLVVSVFERNIAKVVKFLSTLSGSQRDRVSTHVLTEDISVLHGMLGELMR